MRSSYVAILRRPHARPLLVASLLGRLSNATGPLSVVLFVQSETGSLAQAGAASATIALTSGLLAPVRGRLVDRLGQRRCLPPMAAVFAAALVGVVAVAGPGPAAVAATIGLAATAGAAAPPLGASMRVLWISLVGQGPRLQTAYALDAVLDELLFVLGPLLAGGLATLYQPAAGVLATAGLALAGTLGFVASPVSRAQAGSQDASRGRAGWAGALGGPGLRTLALSLAGVGAAIGIWEIGLVGAAREAGSPEAASLLARRLGGGQRRRRALVREQDLAADRPASATWPCSPCSCWPAPRWRRPARSWPSGPWWRWSGWCWPRWRARPTCWPPSWRPPGP